MYLKKSHIVYENKRKLMNKNMINKISSVYLKPVLVSNVINTVTNF